MKKKVVIGTLLAMCMVAALVSPVLAATPALTSITPSNGTPSSTATVPVPVVLIGTGFESGASVAVSGSGITVSDISFVSTTEIDSTFTLAIGVAAGPRDVTVTTSGGTSNGIIFTVNSYITITAPSAISLGIMTVGQATTGNSSSAGTVVTNAANWSVNAVDAKASNKGYMNTVSDGSGTTLTDKLLIGKASSPSDPADTNLTYTQADGTLPFYVSQSIVSGDAAGSYQITITFTGSTS
jgi:hypothetical protein